MTFVALDSLEAIVAAAARHGLVVHDARLDTMGLDFLAVHARDSDGVVWIIRAPRRADVAAGALREAATLAAVHDKLPVAVPDWRISEDVIAYPRLPGTPVVTLVDGGPQWNGIDPAAPAHAFLRRLGETLAALQRVNDSTLAARTIEEERAEVARVIDRSRELLSPPSSILDRWQRWVDHDAMWPTHVALSHGDLHPGHLLLDDSGTLTGVLDWTEGRIGDPGIDFAMMLRCFGADALEVIASAFVAHGGTSWQHLIDHARERVSLFPAAAADWAARTNNEAILEYAKSELVEQLRSE